MVIHQATPRPLGLSVGATNLAAAMDEHRAVVVQPAQRADPAARPPGPAHRPAPVATSSAAPHPAATTTVPPTTPPSAPPSTPPPPEAPVDAPADTPTVPPETTTGA